MAHSTYQRDPNSLSVHAMSCYGTGKKPIATPLQNSYCTIGTSIIAHCYYATLLYHIVFYL